MKKQLLILASAGLFFASCENSADEPKNEFEAEQQKAEEFVNEGSSNATDFNDGLVAQIDMSEVHLAKLMDLDDQNATGDKIRATAEEVIADLDKQIEEMGDVTPYGSNGEEFLSAAISQLYSVKSLAQVYYDFADDLHIPDDEWSQEQGEKWMEMAEPVFADYDETFTNLENQQSLYASYHDMSIVPSDVTIEEMYEQSQE